MSAALKYEVVETYHSFLGTRLGLKPLVTVKDFRWKWRAHLSAFFNSFVGQFGVNIAEVRIAKPRLTVIQGGLSNTRSVSTHRHDRLRPPAGR